MNGFWENCEKPYFWHILGAPRSGTEDPYLCIIYEFLSFLFVLTILPEKTKIAPIFSEKSPTSDILRIFGVFERAQRANENFRWNAT